MKNITVVGIGYVGLSLAVLLSQKYNVTALDIDKEKVSKVNKRLSPIEDIDIQAYLSNKALNLKATTNKSFAFKDADFIIIATPTDYEPSKNYFNTQSVEDSIKEAIDINKNASIIIKSTIPIGFTDKLKNKFNYFGEIMFSPEFLREGKALYDNLYPSRIIVGSNSVKAKEFANMLALCSLKKLDRIDILFTKSREAESIKLFANTYLAMRVAYFNELDTFCEVMGLDTKDVITGISLDDRIGSHYNNPSFGYGGYCLPKDTKQLLSNFENIDNSLIKSIVDSNSIRKDFISKSILKKNPNTVGIYKLIMKEGSDNFRNSAIQGIIKRVLDKGVNVVIYEPNIKSSHFNELEVINNLDLFKKQSSIIIANRLSDDLNDVLDKVYSRDVFREN